MRKLLNAFVIAAALLGLTANAQAQGANIRGVQVAPFAGESRAQVITAADSDVALYVKYFPGVSTGNTSTTTLEVAANGDMTFVVNGAAYAGFECPVSGALGGIIDVSDAACDTLGEVVDVINATAPNFATGYFRAVIAAGLRTDSSNANILVQAASTNVSRPQGQAVLYDSSNNDDVTIGLFDTNLGIRNWIGDGVKRLPKNPFADQEQVLQYASVQVTNAGTIGNYEVHCVVENYNDGKSLSSETDTLLYFEAGAATTVIGKIDEFLNAGGIHCKGGKIVVRALASGADTSAFSVLATGYVAPLKLSY